VTELVPLLPELVPLFPETELPDPFDALEPLELPELLDVPPELAAATFELFESAGSCPVTRTTAISTQAARNSATAPATTRRRIARTRNARAFRIACPRACGELAPAPPGAAKTGSNEDMMLVSSLRGGLSATQRVSPTRSSRVRNG
jgi:hypothetical protein